MVVRMGTKEQLKHIYEQIRKETVIPCVRMELEKRKVTIFESKVGGIPYLPKEQSWPTSPKGKQLSLLAQINCHDLMGLAHFPEKGILQFYINRWDDLLGMNIDDLMKQTEFCVLYFEMVDESVTETMVLQKMMVEEEWAEDDFYPVHGEFALTFTKGEEGISRGDYRMIKKLKEHLKEVCPEEVNLSFLYDHYDTDTEEDLGAGHKMGGYPFFTQIDPREGREDLEFLDTLLFQLDSQMAKEGDLVLWGDCGVGNFFINQEDLKKKDFSNVMFTWDCY